MTAPPARGARDNIGVAVTTHNRPSFLADCLKHLAQNTPDNVPLVVVDDGSVPPAQIPAEYGATVIRHPVALGIPAAKNRCIAELMREDVEHLFLLDDDTWPQLDGWWMPYTDGPEPHYQYNWSTHEGRALSQMREIYRDHNLVVHSRSFGCMLYLHRGVVERVGGFDLRFGMGGEEHLEYSQRIHNADLTSFVHQDVPASQDCQLFWASDEHQTGIRSSDRFTSDLQQNEALRLKLAESDQFVPYLSPRDVVLTFFSTTHVDPQINRRRDAHPHIMRPLIESVGPWSDRLVILHDCFVEAQLRPVECHRVPTPISPYNQRWISYYQYLRAHPEIRFGWLVDATDVRMLKEPFDQMKPGYLYCGWDATVVGNDWVQAHSHTVSHWVDAHANQMLLNCGVVGGDRATLMRACRRMIDMWSDYGGDPLQETVWFNMVARSQEFDNRLITGPSVCTEHKARNNNDPYAWWCHQ